LNRPSFQPSLLNTLSISVLALSASLSLSCDGTKTQQVAEPIELTQEATCDADGMMIMEFDGPKAQILWENGERSFFCEAREAFEFWTNPIQRNRIRAFYLQDFGGVGWGSYPDRWILAQDATFVIGSKKLGAMGISYVSFAKPSDARIFQLEHGGRSLLLEEITPEVFESSQMDQIRQMQEGVGVNK
jgi:copper chaperone NosL